jgi:hypothetical protein
MAYLLRAFIARKGVLEVFATENPKDILIPLAQDFEMVLNESRITQASENQIHQIEINREFASLTANLISLATSASHLAPIAYIENECFGGPCDQFGIVWQAGAVIYGPELVEGNIGTVSAVLRLIGVKKDESNVDEFEALGLSRFRSHADWLKSYTNPNSTESP